MGHATKTAERDRSHLRVVRDPIPPPIRSVEEIDLEMIFPADVLARIPEVLTEMKRVSALVRELYSRYQAALDAVERKPDDHDVFADVASGWGKIAAEVEDLAEEVGPAALTRMSAEELADEMREYDRRRRRQEAAW